MKTTIVRLGTAALASVMLSVTTETEAAALFISNLFEPTFSDGRIETVQTDGTGRRVLREVGGGLRGLAIDVAGGDLFWSDVNTDRIELVRLDNPSVIPTGIITSGLQFAIDLEVSASAEKLFWADQSLGEIAISNLNGSNQTVLFSAASTSAIGVDDVNGKIYSEDRSTAALGSIVKFNFDGSGFETVITNVPTANAIAIDPIREYVFWTSSAGLSEGNGGVYRVNFDGTDFREIFVMGSNLDTGGIALDLAKEYVYWGQETANNRSDIYRMKLDGSSPEVVSTGYGNISDMVLVSEFPTIVVSIDIKPGRRMNKINPKSRGGIWVAVLSGSEFDPLQIDIPTVRFGPDEAKAIRYRVKDINRDGLGDLLLRFKIRKTGIACGDSEATLTGETFGGQSITGTDSLKTVGCKRKHLRDHDEHGD
ncbi:MAG: hypothetical protein ACR2P1_27950 [Pseudomonadales bacterium]